MKRQMTNYAPEEILNTDQMGLELELHSTILKKIKELSRTQQKDSAEMLSSPNESTVLEKR